MTLQVWAAALAVFAALIMADLVFTKGAEGLRAAAIHSPLSTAAARAARRGIAARAVPGFGDEGEQPGRDVRPALLTSAEAPRGQPGESLFDVLQFPAGHDRLAQTLLRLRPARPVSRGLGNVRGGVVGQGQLGELLQPGLPPGLQQRPPARAVTSLERGACYRASFCGHHALLNLAVLPAR